MIHLSLTKSLYLDIRAALRLRLEACLESEDTNGVRRWRRAIKWLDENWVEEEELRKYIRARDREMAPHRRREKERQKMRDEMPVFELDSKGRIRKKRVRK